MVKDALEINVWFEICEKCNIKINLVLKGLKLTAVHERLLFVGWLSWPFLVLDLHLSVAILIVNCS